MEDEAQTPNGMECEVVSLYAPSFNSRAGASHKV